MVDDAHGAFRHLLLPSRVAGGGRCRPEAERWYVRHSLAMRDTFTKKPIVLYADNPAFQQNNVVGYLTEASEA